MWSQQFALWTYFIRVYRRLQAVGFCEAVSVVESVVEPVSMAPNSGGLLDVWGP